MKVIHIAEDGNDENDGSSRKRAVHSRTRAYSLAAAGDVFQMGRATMERISAEIEKETRAAKQFARTIGPEGMGGPPPQTRNH